MVKFIKNLFRGKVARAEEADLKEYHAQTTEEERAVIEELGYDGWRDQLAWIREFGSERVLLLSQEHHHVRRFEHFSNDHFFRDRDAGIISPGHVNRYLGPTDDLDREKYCPETLAEYRRLGIGFGWIKSFYPYLDEFKSYSPEEGEKYGFDHAFYGRVHDVGFRAASSGLMNILKLPVTARPANEIIEGEKAVTLGFIGNETGNDLFLKILYASKGNYIERREVNQHPV
ncbi:MAG: hypothetical protein ABH851_08505 [Methanobacteriota archaeon]